MSLGRMEVVSFGPGAGESPALTLTDQVKVYLVKCNSYATSVQAIEIAETGTGAKIQVAAGSTAALPTNNWENSDGVFLNGMVVTTIGTNLSAQIYFRREKSA